MEDTCKVIKSPQRTVGSSGRGQMRATYDFGLELVNKIIEKSTGFWDHNKNIKKKKFVKHFRGIS